MQFNNLVNVRFSIFLSLFVLTGLLFSPRIYAATQENSVEETPHREKNRTALPVIVKLRYAHPFGAIDMLFPQKSARTTYYVINIIDLSLSLDILELFTAEAGGSYHIANIIYGTCRGYFGRIGIMPHVVDTRRPDYRGSTLQAGGMAGVRATIHETYHEMEDLEYKGLFATVTGALEYTYWFRKHFGLCFRFIAETGAPFYQTYSSDWKDSEGGGSSWFLRLALSAGLAF
jgi:hypothetical protein